MAAENDTRQLLDRGLVLLEKLKHWGGPGSARLQKLVRGELAFVNRLVGLPSLPSSCPELRSSNFEHLEAVFNLLRNPLLCGVIAVMRNFPAPSMEGTVGPEDLKGLAVAHVDIVCMLHGKPVWLVVSTRNPKSVKWNTGRGLRSRVFLLLSAASSDTEKRPESVVLCFSGILQQDVDEGLTHEFGAVRSFSLEEDRSTQTSNISLESSMVVVQPTDVHIKESCNFSEVEGGEWLDVELSEDLETETAPDPKWVTYEINVSEVFRRNQEKHNSELDVKDAVVSEATEVDLQKCEVTEGAPEIKYALPRDKASQSSLGDEYCSSTEQNRRCHSVNLDTTALVALVSELSNGGAEDFLETGDADLSRRFPSMASFIREQAISESEKSLVEEIEGAIGDRQPVICEYVRDEFNSIISTIAGPREKNRAKELMSGLRVVPNTPSPRIMALPTTGRIKERHKLVFGTADSLSIPTLSANMAFVRAVFQRGMALEVIEHRPRALVGE